MWRYTARPVQLAILDARACLPLLAVIVYWSWTTLYIAVFGTVFFGERFGIGRVIAAALVALSIALVNL